MSVNQLLYPNNYNLNGSFVGAITEVSAGTGISVTTSGSIATVNQKTVSGLIANTYTWPSTVIVDGTGTITGISESYIPANIVDHFVMVGSRLIGIYRLLCFNRVGAHNVNTGSWCSNRNNYY